jgi:hypothetical protein
VNRRLVLVAPIVALTLGVVGCGRRAGRDETSHAIPASPAAGAVSSARSSATDSLPRTVGVPFIRVDFATPAAWDRLKKIVSRPDDSGYTANLEYVEDRALTGLDEGALESRFPRLYPDAYGHPVVFVADAAAMRPPDYPVLVMNLNRRETSRPFRAVPGEIASIEANLSLANMDYFEFVENAGSDGVFRGFR